MTALNHSRQGHPQTTFEDLKGLRAEGYVRDSTLDQRDGSGPDIQRGNIRRFAQSYGLLLGDRWYTEFVSSYRQWEKRSQLHRFHEDARLDRYDVLLVDHTSRFGRNQAECIRYKGELQKLGKLVVFVSQGIISGSDRDFISERINETLDEAYSRNLSRYTSAGLAEKAAQGHALGKVPLGFRHLPRASGRGVDTAPDEKSMPALLALLRGYAGGHHSFRTLAQELNTRGHRTNTGRPFTDSSVSTALNNPFYSGRFIYHRSRPDQEIREGAHHVPTEVKELWLQCQEMRDARRKAGNPSPPSRQHLVYPLTGVLVCDGCGEPFHGTACRSHGGTFRRMFHSVRRCGLTPLSVGAPRIEQEFSDRVLSQVALDPGWRAAVLRALALEGPEPDHTVELQRVQGALANLRKQHLWGVISDEDCKSEFVALARQRKALETPKVSALTPNLDRAAQLLQDLPALWQHSGVSPEQRRELAREVFQEVRMRQGSLTAVMPRPQYAPLFAYSLWRQNVAGGERSS